MLGAYFISLAMLGQTPEPARPGGADRKDGLGELRRARSREIAGKPGQQGPAGPAPALKSKDAEVRSRAKAMINKIEGNLLIEPTTVRLDYNDAPLDDVLKSLSKQAGFEIGLGRAMPISESRRVTLREPEPVPFWKAIDRLCEVGQLTYHVPPMPFQIQGASQPALTLSYQTDSWTQPSYNHGPFHVMAVSVYYQSQISLNVPREGSVSSAVRPAALAKWPRKPHAHPPSQRSKVSPLRVRSKKPVMARREPSSSR